LFVYFGYSRWVDRKVWGPDPKRPTPAHMYMDGVEFFPVSRFVLYGFQWNSIAALGPILGPGIALTFGWLPAFLWIIFAALLIGWVQDYSSMFLSVRKEAGPSVRWPTRCCNRRC
jgi:carbon starvation protein